MKRLLCDGNNDVDGSSPSVSCVDGTSDEASCVTETSCSDDVFARLPMRELVAMPGPYQRFACGVWPQDCHFSPFYCKTWNGPRRGRYLTPDFRPSIPVSSELYRRIGRRQVRVHPAKFARAVVTKRELSACVYNAMPQPMCGNYLCINPYHDKTNPLPIPEGRTIDDDDEEAHSPFALFIPPRRRSEEKDDNDDGIS